ncbi:MAG: PRC-barrel domain-containing protein [Aldersonia sp.]|nr:PRC-barrel domain-containing protein [Aldersonia sp.]
MLAKATDLIGRSIRAIDGEIGSVKTVYFDDDRWTVRYLVVDTGHWLPGRLVLISPFSLWQAESSSRSLDTGLSREQVKNSPDVDTERPISRQHEVAYSDYYGYPYYWAGPSVWGAAAVPIDPVIPPGGSPEAAAARRDVWREHDERNSHLRDVKHVAGYHIHATDGSIGHVEDFLVDGRSWTIRYLIVDTSNWIGGRHVLIAPGWVSGISWEGTKIDIGLTRDAIRNSPEYDSAGAVQRNYEDRLHAHYVKSPYWIEGNEGRAGDRMARLEQLADLEIADGHTDVRGWRVLAADGVTVGRVEHLIVDSGAMQVRYLEVGLDAVHAGGEARDVLIPIEHVDLDKSARDVRLRRLPSRRMAALPPFTGLPIDREQIAQTRRHFVAPVDQARGEPAVHGTPTRRS